jgi:Asp-tRNA(Asn)/Glu-tRNA(Gln) amidotransferase A subunit family amidase
VTGVSELAYLSATDALARFAARELSPVELLDALIARAEQTEPRVNAFAETRFEAARAAARAAERRYGGRGEPPRPLEGIAVAVKEAQPLAGHVVTDGLDDDPAAPPATRSAFAVERIEAAGGIVHARTTTSELCCMPMSHAVRWGITRNPWDLDAAVGGSSGGAAAALAAGTTTLATGGDIGGSIRVPAGFAGVVGYKPPHGRIPLEPPQNLDWWMHAGPMARTPADARLLAELMSGPHPDDPTSRIRPGLVPTTPRELRVGWCPRPGDLPVSDEVAALLMAAGSRLAAEGVAVEDVEIEWSLAEIKRAMWGRGDQTLARTTLEREQRRPGTISPYARVCFEQSLAYAAEVPAAERPLLERRIDAALMRVLAAVDVVVIPVNGVVAMDAGEDYADRPLKLDGRPLQHFCDAALTPMLNVSSACPALVVPVGRSARGVPVGAQIVGRPYDEESVWRVASRLSAAMPWSTVLGGGTR